MVFISLKFEKNHIYGSIIIYCPGYIYAKDIVFQPSRRADIVTNNYSKLHEYVADKLASAALARCFDISLDHQVQIFQFMQVETKDTGGFWDQHPLWDDRIGNIKKAP